MNSKQKKDKKSWWKVFTEKQRLSLNDSDDGHERWYMYITLSKVLIGLLALLLMLFLIVAAIVAYTPVMDLIPGYPGSKSRGMLVRNIMRLDSLEREMAHITMYSDNMALILDGKTPIIRDVSRIGDSIKVQNKLMIPPGIGDSILRAQMEGDGLYSLSSAVANRAQQSAFDLVAPLQGLVQGHFNPVRGQFGIEIRTTANQPVVAIREGSIIMSVWTPDVGNIIQIQHPDNIISVYKGISHMQNSVGTRVRGGEIIGIAGQLGEEEFDAVRPFGFELWYNGTPVDPENHIVF